MDSLIILIGRCSMRRLCARAGGYGQPFSGDVFGFSVCWSGVGWTLSSVLKMVRIPRLSISQPEGGWSESGLRTLRGTMPPKKLHKIQIFYLCNS